jgi:8-oxo-dGTP pyrophosphatase MutT (NUDIX family)
VAEEAPKPAATVVVLRDSSAGPEVFMVRRHTGTAFRGAHVFPGGRVDAADGDVAAQSWCDGLDHAAQRLAGLAPAEAIGFYVAAVRELFEETGVLLARHGDGRLVSIADDSTRERFAVHRADVHRGARALRAIAESESLRLALDALVLFAHWVTPPQPIERRRFDTRFFMTRVPPGQVPAHDDRETTDGEWLTPRDAIARALRRELVLPPPTWVTLRELEHHPTVDDALRWAAARPVLRRQPAIVQEETGRVLIMPQDDSAGAPIYERRFALRDGAWGPLGEAKDTNR